MPKTKEIKIRKVLCDSGESPIEPTVEEPISRLIEYGGLMLDTACLNNVVVLEASDGKFYVGEFMFKLTPVSKKEAARVTKTFGHEDDE